MRRWLLEKGTSGTRTFHSRRLSNSQAVAALQRRGPVNAEAGGSTTHAATIDDLLHLSQEEVGDDNMSVSSASSVSGGA
jgi:hypothetical protein